MGAINYMQPTHHDLHLLALAVFVDPLRTAYARSIQVHEENVGSLCTVQQDFLLNPGGNATISQPEIPGSFRTFMSGAGVKQIMDSIIKMHHNEGWHCVLEYRSDSPSETFMSYPLFPSRNVDLKKVPSLEQDLKFVESAVMSSRINRDIMLKNDEIISSRRDACGGEGKAVHTDNHGWLSSSLTLSCPSSLTVSDRLNDHIPGLETPHGQQLDIWQNWGSELELASAKISHSRASQLNQATHNSSSPVSSQNPGYVGALWNPSTLLDLNLESTEFPSQDKDVDCIPVLSNPVSKPTSCLNLQLGMPSLSSQQSTVTEDNMDCCSLECFGDSLPCYNNMVIDPSITKLAKASAKSMCSEDSVGCHGCVINMSPWDVSANSLITSSHDMHSTALEKCSGCMDDGKMLKNSVASTSMYSVAHLKNAGYLSVEMVFKDSPATSITSSDIYSAEYKKYGGCMNGEKGSLVTSSKHSGWGQGNESSGRASCSSISTQSVQQGSNKVNTSNKPPIVRPGSTSERLPEITLQELSQYFSMPITQAAKELKVGLTVLKKRCRLFGISRWPHRKMKSIDSLIYNIQGLAEDQGAKSSPRVRNAVRELEEQKKLMEEMPGVELAERTKKLRQACFKANYKKRKLGTAAVNSTPCKFLSPHPLAITHSFDILNPSALVIIPSPPHHGSLPSMPTSSYTLR